MANANAPMGLTPRRYRNGAPWNGVLRVYYVPASDANNIFIGDPVVITGTGDSNGIPGATIATAGGRITGVVVGIRPSAPFMAKYRLASTATYILVADDPELLFEVQDNGTASTNDLGANANLVVGAGSVGTGNSGWQLDSTTKATTATLQVRIVEFEQRIDNALGANGNWLVAINLPTETGAAGALGV